MIYDLNYMLNHDIDWFCMINGVYVHVASAGGIIPESMRDREVLRKLQHNVSIAPEIFADEDIEYNEQYLNNHFPDAKEREDYVRSFRDMARKGFISMDRTNWSNPESNIYHVVCRPKRSVIPINQEDERFLIPCQIQKDDLELGVDSNDVILLEFFDNKHI